MEIVQATLDDFEGIVALLRRYHVDYISPEDKKDGFVTTNLTTDQLTRLIVDEQGVTIAKKRMAAYMPLPWQHRGIIGQNGHYLLI